VASAFPTLPAGSPFRVDKARVEATLRLSTGDSIPGRFFVAHAGAHGSAPERVIEILNAEPGFIPFETGDGPSKRTVLFNRSQIITVELSSPEAAREPGYDVATLREIVLRLSDGRLLRGAVRVHRPEGRDRLSDWARHTAAFRYLEVAGVTLIVNVSHVVELSEVVR
jgi:hypothetical protein